MKTGNSEMTDELRPEYKRSDFGEIVRGKYANRIKHGCPRRSRRRRKTERLVCSLEHTPNELPTLYRPLHYCIMNLQRSIKNESVFKDRQSRCSSLSPNAVYLGRCI
jgi:hypothetical protein